MKIFWNFKRILSLCFFSDCVTVTECSEESLKTSGGYLRGKILNKDIEFTVQGNSNWPLMFIYLCPNQSSSVGQASGEVIRVPLSIY